jgi:hypothetical protein
VLHENTTSEMVSGKFFLVASDATAYHAVASSPEGSTMSFFSKLTGKSASESAHLKKIRLESEQRRAGKSGENATVKDADQFISKTVTTLANRIKSGPAK